MYMEWMRKDFSIYFLQMKLFYSFYSIGMYDIYFLYNNQYMKYVLRNIFIHTHIVKIITTKNT